jgi:hypothetical protein
LGEGRVAPIPTQYKSKEVTMPSFLTDLSRLKSKAYSRIRRKARIKEVIHNGINQRGNQTAPKRRQRRRPISKVDNNVNQQIQSLGESNLTTQENITR